MITIILNLLLGINFVYGIYNGKTIPDPSNKMIKFPWMIRMAIFFDLNEEGSPDIDDFFGGTLITTTHILTVAHPFHKPDGVDPNVFKKGYQGIAYAGVYSKSEIPDPENCMLDTERARDEVGNLNCRFDKQLFLNLVLIYYSLQTMFRRDYLICGM